MNKYVLAAIALIIVIAGAWWFMRPATAPTETVNVPAQKEFSLTITERKVVSGETTLKVNQGDSVKITITADEDEEFHVHGYDVSADLTAGVPATLTFTADTSGRFPFELEESKTELGALEVAP